VSALATSKPSPVQLTKYTHLAIRKVPHSGPDDTILANYGIDSGAIVKAVREMQK